MTAVSEDLLARIVDALVGADADDERETDRDRWMETLCPAPGACPKKHREWLAAIARDASIEVGFHAIRELDAERKIVAPSTSRIQIAFAND